MRDTDRAPGWGLELVSCCAMSPHVHVQDGDKLAKLWLEPLALAASTGFAAHELTRVQTLVAQHRDRLLEAWNEFFRA